MSNPPGDSGDSKPNPALQERRFADPPCPAPGGVSRLEPEWLSSDSLVPYPDAIDLMERRVEAIRAGTAPELVWLLEHPPLYTAGTGARTSDLLDAGDLPVYPTGRGGKYTFHGPGQRIGYVMIDLQNRGRDLRRFVNDLEEWLIRALGTFGIRGERRAGRVGIWVVTPDGEERKIAAIGVRVRRWMTFHGVSLNVDPDLGLYRGIVPCGIAEFGVTSMAALGVRVPMAEIDAAMRAAFGTVFM